MNLVPDYQDIVAYGACAVPIEAHDRYFAIVAQASRREVLTDRGLMRAVRAAVARCREEVICAPQ